MNPRHKKHGLVLVDNLCALSLVPLLKACFRLRPTQLYYFRASRMGLKLSGWIKNLKIISGDPNKIQDLYLNDTKDSAASILRFNAQQDCIRSQDRIFQEVKKILPEFDSFFQQICATGVRKEWQIWLQELYLQLHLAKALAREEEASTRNVVLISHSASLLKILNVDPEISGNIKVYPQTFENKALLYLFGPVIYTLGKTLMDLLMSWFSPRKEVPRNNNDMFKIGTSAAWGFEGFDKNRLDDLFWWRRSQVPAEQIVYMFERQDYQPTRNRMVELEKMGIQSIALNPKYLGDAHEFQVKNKIVSLTNNLKVFLFYLKLALRGLLKDKLTRSIYSLVGWQIYKSEELIPIYKGINLRGIFHFNESSLEFVNLSAQKSNAARIGTHWSCLSAPNASTPRCHEVYFAWGAHDLKIILDSGSISKNILVSGCFLSELSNKSEHLKGKEAVQSMKDKGVRIVLTLFDNSFPVPNFYRFFLQWLVDDPNLGILIKSKGGTFESSCEDRMGGLVQQAKDSGRIFVMNEKASPVDAAMLSDFAIGITGISAIAVSGLQGARVLYIDYEKLDQSALKPYSIFHSLGPNRCVFYDMESLKNAVLEYTKNPGSNPNLGDVSPILDQLDPFRDGKASQRIGEYVNWYLESLGQNSSKMAALKTASEKYAEKWGADKVIRSNF